MTTAQKRTAAAAAASAWAYLIVSSGQDTLDFFAWTITARTLFIMLVPMLALYAAAYPGWED